MSVLSEEYLDKLLAPKAIDPCWVAQFLQPHMPNCTLQELETLVAERVVLDGFNCICQAPPDHGAVEK